MFNSTFTTQRLLKKFSISILKTGLHIIKKTPFESSEFDLSFEHIETKKTVETKLAFGLPVLILFLVFVSLLFFLNGQSEESIFFFVLSVIVVIVAFLTKLRVITIKSYEGQNIELYFTSRNKDEVLAFADTIISSANTFLLNKFSKIDKDLPIGNQLENLDFLRNKELLSEVEFEQLKDQLLGRDNKKSIGFM